MKKLFTILLSIMTFGIAHKTYGQINLIHTFENNVGFTSGLIDGEVNIFSESYPYPIGTYHFTEVDAENNTYTVRIYNGNFTLQSNKTYYLSAPEGYSLSSAYPTRKLFNSDDKYEFLVSLRKKDYTSYDNESQRLILEDENGGVIKDFGTAYSISPYYFIHVVNNQRRYMITKSVYDENKESKTTTEIYSVPGSGIPSGRIDQSAEYRTPPYPNPTNYTIFLPYLLKSGDFAIMNIYSINGQLIEQKQIGYDFDKIELDVSAFPKGIYLYEVNGQSNKFVVD